MRLEPMGGGLAVRVDGVRLEDGLDDGDFARLDEAWVEHYCLVFPDQQGLSIDAHVALLEHFGPVLEERLPGDKHSFVTNAAGFGVDEMNEGYLWGELTAHMDFTYTRFPADVISLHAQELPVGGTSTLFYSNVDPLDRMPPELRDELRGYSIRCVHDPKRMPPDARPYLDPRACEGEWIQVHDWPLIRKHPLRPGLEVLYCNLQQTAEILGVPSWGASQGLLERLFFEYLYTPENRHEHQWALGDLVLWDNCAIQHARQEIDRSGGARVLRRVSVCEAGNGVEETVSFLNLHSTAGAFS